MSAFGGTADILAKADMTRYAITEFLFDMNQTQSFRLQLSSMARMVGDSAALNQSVDTDGNFHR